MGFLVALIPLACCAAVPAVLFVWALLGSKKRNKVQDIVEQLERPMGYRKPSSEIERLLQGTAPLFEPILGESLS